MSITASLENPYHFGRPVEGVHFFDREEELRRIFGFLRSGMSVSLLGERRSGCTSLLLKTCHVIQSQAPWPDGFSANSALLGVYINAQDLRSTKKFYSQIIRSVQEQESALGLPLGDDQSHFTSLLESLSQSGRKLVLLIDEFAAILANKAFAMEWNLLRSKINDGRIILVTVTPKPIDDYFIPDGLASPFFNVFPIQRIGPFDQESFDHFLTQRAESSRFPVADCRKQVLDLGGRWPFFTQMACWLYWEIWRKAGSLTVENHAVVRGQFADQAESHFKYMWRHLLPEEQELLTCLAKLPVEQQVKALHVLVILQPGTAVSLSRHPKPEVEELRIALSYDNYASPEQKERALTAWAEFSPEMRRALLAVTVPIQTMQKLTENGYLLDGKQLFSSAFTDFVLKVARGELEMARGKKSAGELIIITEEDLRRYGRRP